MNLNEPGESLFQGNEFNNFENLFHVEEEEAIEDQKRRDLELKNMLENAFDDVSIDNDEVSIYNGSSNHSVTNHSTFHNNSKSDFNIKDLNKSTQNGLLIALDKNNSKNLTECVYSPLKHPRYSVAKRVDFNNEEENYSDQGRKKIQNGNLHDVVDASGGGNMEESLHYKHCFQRSPMGEIAINGLSNNNNSDSLKKVQFTEEAEDSTEQLKILYDVRVREVHRLTELLDSMKKEHDIGIRKLKHQLALSQAEIERSNISQTQLQSLLVSNKQEIENMEKRINDLENENSLLESCKSQLVKEVETNKLIINDLERKVLVYEKGNKVNSDTVQYQLNLKAIIEKHNIELCNMNMELEKLTKANNELQKENSELKHRNNQISQTNDEIISKKSEIISRLSKQIDEIQRQYESLMKSSTAEDNLRLQMELKILRDEKQLLVTQLDALEKENSQQEEELKQYESISRLTSCSTFVDPNDLDGTDISGKLGAELQRSLNGQKAKRQEIKNLQNQLKEKSARVSMLEESEKILKNEVVTLNNEVNRLSNEIKNYKDVISVKETEMEKLENYISTLKTEMEKAELCFQMKANELEKEMESLKENENNKTVQKYNEEFMRFHNEGLERVREETEKFYKLEILRKDLESESLKSELEEIKNLYVEVIGSKESLLKQLEKEKGTAGRSSLVDVDEVKRLQKELEKSRHRILELDQTLKQQYEQEVDILNLDINQLKLQVEKLKKEKDREVSEKDKIFIENDLLKSEIEQVTSDKNFLILKLEKLRGEMESACRKLESLRRDSENELKEQKEKHDAELQAMTNKYEITIQKLKKEIDLLLAKSVKCESKYTSPKKSLTRTVESQCSPVAAETLSVSPKSKGITKDISTSPISVCRSNSAVDKERSMRSPSMRNVGVSTDPDTNGISRKEVVEIMEKLGAHHENEMKVLENKYRAELVKLDKKFHVEIDRAKELIRAELEKLHAEEINEMTEKHRIELENRIEQEKKEAVADLITEWACEVQSLKASYAEANSEMERLKMKYKAAKSVALQYKTYFKNKTEYMKEEWKRIEGGYEQALKELEKNVHILVDVKEDEVKAKVDSITKIYEQKINKMKEKLSKCEDRLKAKRDIDGKKKTPKFPIEFEFKRELERLEVPTGNLCLSPAVEEKKLRERDIDLGL